MEITASAKTIETRLMSRGRETQPAVEKRLARGDAYSVTDRRLRTIANDGEVATAAQTLVDLLIGLRRTRAASPP